MATLRYFKKVLNAASANQRQKLGHETRCETPSLLVAVKPVGGEECHAGQQPWFRRAPRTAVRTATTKTKAFPSTSTFPQLLCVCCPDVTRPCFTNLPHQSFTACPQQQVEGRIWHEMRDFTGLIWSRATPLYSVKEKVFACRSPTSLSSSPSTCLHWRYPNGPHWMLWELFHWFLTRRIYRGTIQVSKSNVYPTVRHVHVI